MGLPMAVTSRVVTAESAQLHVEERGEGEPLLLLHGMMGTGADWKYVFDLDALASEFRVIAPDARGHGRSTNPGGDFSFERCGRDALAILDALGIGRFRALGLSLGAKTLLHVATVAPERVSAMILVSATPRFPEATRALFREAAAQDHSPEDRERMRKVHVHGDAQVEALWALPRRFADDATGDMSFTRERLATITARTLIVSGDRDPFYPVELAVELYRGIPRASLWVVPNGMHGPIFVSEREAFVREAMLFLRAG
jgi:pimeloyl-ACP methyl ester carboxylesterase